MATLAEEDRGGARLVSLDFIRGIAVMGILLANLPAFALPESAYFSPLSAGGTGSADRAAWFANFVLVEGRMRALFSMLFGASLLLIVDRARAADANPFGIHFGRMAALFLFGLAHLYLVWWGDILAHYALVGVVAFAFTLARTRTLLLWAVGFLALALLYDAGGYAALIDSASRSTPRAIATWTDFARGFGVPPPAEINSEIAAMRGAWADQLQWRVRHIHNPVELALVLGPQTLSAMLFGMAAFRSGLLTGEWSRRALKICAAASLGLAFAAYGVLGAMTMASGFDQRLVYLGSILASEPFRVIGAIGYVALAMLLIRPGGLLSERIAAVGRAAFTNYLGTSIIATGIFYGWGLGLFASVSRAALYWLAPLVWVIMLAWSKPWLDHFAYGPFEWAWRSLSRLRLQPMRRPRRVLD